MSTQPMDDQQDFPGIIPPELIAPDDATRKRLALIDRLQKIAKSAEEITVTNGNEYLIAAGLLLTLKSARRQLDELCRPEIQKRYEAHRAATKEFNSADKPLELACDTVSSRMTAWEREQEEHRLKEQERLEALHQQEAEEEAKRNAVEDKLQHAIELEQSGQSELAEQVLNEPTETLPVYVGPVVLASEVPRVEGLSKRQTWKCGVTDLAALVKAVADGKVPLMAIQPNDKFLGQQARSLKTHLNYPGVRVWADDSHAGRG